MECKYLNKNSCPQYSKNNIKEIYCDELNCKYAKRPQQMELNLIYDMATIVFTHYE